MIKMKPKNYKGKNYSQPQLIETIHIVKILSWLITARWDAVWYLVIAAPKALKMAIETIFESDKYNSVLLFEISSNAALVFSM